MKKTAAPRKPGRVADEAVLKATGKGWKEWFAILDAAGATRMSHGDMAAWLNANDCDSGWWRQKIVIHYELARGMREKHQTAKGYQISVSRTIAVPVAKAYKAWHDAKARDRWLGEKGLVIRKANVNTNLRITWADAKTSLEVMFLAKGDAKCQVVAQHSKLADAKSAARMKKFWAAALGRLKEVLEG